MNILVAIEQLAAIAQKNPRARLMVEEKQREHFITPVKQLRCLHSRLNNVTNTVLCSATLPRKKK